VASLQPERASDAAVPLRPPGLTVQDHLESRIRKPADLLRCIACGAEITVLIVAGIAARATMTGVETDIVGASRRLPDALLTVASPLAFFALLVVPTLALSVRHLVRRQPRRLAEALATGILAFLLVSAANIVLRRASPGTFYDTIVMSRPGATQVTPLDGYLAGLTAYATMIGLTGRPGWRNALWLTTGTYALVNLASLHTTVLSLLISLLAGRVVGLGVRYAAGSRSLRPSAAAIAAAVGGELTEIRRVRQAGDESRRYLAQARAGGRLDILVYDRDQQAAGAFHRLYRALLLRRPVSEGAPLSVDRAVEHQALLSRLTSDADVLTPRLRRLVRAGPEAVVLGYEHHDGITLADQGQCDDAALRDIWDAVLRLHANGVTHRALTADHLLLLGDGRVMLLGLGAGDVAAGDLQMRLDLAQLIAELAIVAGPERSAGLAIEKAGAAGLDAVVPLLQPVALARSTAAALRRHPEILPALRKRLLTAVPGGEVAPVQLARVRLRTLVTLVAAAAAAYLLAGELAGESISGAVRRADWRWGVVALGLSVLTYVGATWSLSGFAPDQLPFRRTFLVQVAGSFVALVAPAAVGGAALNVRYLQRRKIPGPVAVASVGVAQVVAFVLHTLLLIVFVAIAGTSSSLSSSSRANPLNAPAWTWLVIAGLGVVAVGVLAVPAARRVLRARVSPLLGQVLPRLLQVAQQPRKVALGAGGALALSASYILCLAACVQAFGGAIPIATIAVVYLTGVALGSAIPTPGGLGTVDTALTAGLTTAGLHGAAAASSVLLFRLLTLWLPVPAGWVALNYLERKQAL
jgi:uncharacterized membrane protein YbhN (UPF0104 family)